MSEQKAVVKDRFFRFLIAVGKLGAVVQLANMRMKDASDADVERQRQLMARRLDHLTQACVQMEEIIASLETIPEIERGSAVTGRAHVCISSVH